MLTDRERSTPVIRPPYALSPPRSVTTPQHHPNSIFLTASRHARTPGRPCTRPCDMLRLEKTAILQHSSSTPGYNFVHSSYDGMDGTFCVMTSVFQLGYPPRSRMRIGFSGASVSGAISPGCAHLLIVRKKGRGSCQKGVSGETVRESSVKKRASRDLRFVKQRGRQEAVVCQKDEFCAYGLVKGVRVKKGQEIPPNGGRLHAVCKKRFGRFYVGRREAVIRA